MSTPPSKLWFSDGDLPFTGSEPYFFDSAAFPWVAQVESQWQVFRDEMMANLGRDADLLAPYVNQAMTSRPNQWKTMGLMFWTVRSEENCRKFPKSWDILKDVPNLIAVSFNLLEPGTTIKPHMGNTNAIVRCHLGLVVPEPAPRCGFRVGSETRSWDEGKFLMFCDAHQHTAWNNTASQRYIMVLDIMRPEFSQSKLSVSSRVLAAIYHQAAYQKDTWLKRIFGGERGRAFTFLLFRWFYRLSLRRQRLSESFVG